MLKSAIEADDTMSKHQAFINQDDYVECSKHVAGSLFSCKSI